MNLYYCELDRKIKKYDEKSKYLIVNDSVLNEVLDVIEKNVGIEEFANIKILIETGNKLPNDITLKDVILMIWIRKELTYIVLKYS